jgi:RNA polymerase sigma factor (sigma-70 family)
VGDCAIAPLLRGLRSPNAGNAWVEFLDSYGAVLYHTARTHTSGEDAAADCYVHICEQLARNHFKRLLKFNPAGRSSFTTLLRVVARNLCFDWHRNQSGRHRPFKALNDLSPLELEIYRLRFTRGASQDETIQQIASEFPAVGADTVCAIEEQLQYSLNSRQRWILSMRQQRELSTSVAIAGEDGASAELDIPDPKPNQETVFLTDEQQKQLRRAVGALPADERLLLQLRFEHDLTLDEVARLCGLSDGQRVHRRVSAVLNKLRSVMR